MLNSANNQAGQLGYIVSWRVQSPVSVDELRLALAAAGLSPGFARRRQPQQAISRALRDMRAGRVITRLRPVDAYHVSFQLTLVGADEAQAHFDREAVVTLDLHTGSIWSDDAYIGSRARELLAKHVGTMMPADISCMIQRIYEEHRADLVAIREQGGAYFVPQAHAALVDATRKLLDTIGGRLQSFAVRLGCADTSESVAQALTEHLQRLTAELREQCTALPADGRSYAVQRRMERVAELRSKLAGYRDLLGAYAASISAQLDATENALLAAIARPAAPSAPMALAE